MISKQSWYVVQEIYFSFAFCYIDDSSLSSLWYRVIYVLSMSSCFNLIKVLCCWGCYSGLQKSCSFHQNTIGSMLTICLLLLTTQPFIVLVPVNNVQLQGLVSIFIQELKYVICFHYFFYVLYAEDKCTSIKDSRSKFTSCVLFYFVLFT